MANRVVLASCPGCGEHNVQSHGKYVKLCNACGMRYAKYHNYRTLVAKEPTVKREQVLLDIIAEYQILKARGFKVPESIKKGL